jgi:uncharacterized protein YbaR (Trm112 family)
MKYASSIKYGGQLIDAKDCDYNSYKHLGLVCPECKNPVFVRAEHTRTAPKSKEVVKVEQSFAHFKAVDPAQVLACENRVAAYNRRGLERKAAAAKNQRLKLLHRWFWDIYYRCFELERRIVGIDKEENRRRLTALAHQICSETEMQQVIKAFQSFTPEEIAALVHSHVEGLAEDAGANPQSVFVKTKMQFLSSVDRTLHCMICNEVVEFLGAKRQLPLLEQVVTVSKIISEQSPFLQQHIAAGLDRLPAAVVRHVIISLCFIDWAGEFEKLKAAD